MNYLIFDNNIYYDSEGKRGVTFKEKLEEVFPKGLKDVSVAVIDSLQKKVSATEKNTFKKDEALAGAFSGDYVTQAERLDEDLFQVVAIEKNKLNEIYKHLGFENIRLIVPYALALREFLKANNLFSKEKGIVFLDHLGKLILLTIYKDNAFSSPRRLGVNNKRLLEEISRSQKNYRDLNENEKNIDFLIITNSKGIREEIIKAGNEKQEDVIFIDDAYPALTGLRTGKFSLHYMLPEQFLRLRKLKVLKRQLKSLGFALGVFLISLAFFSASQVMNKKELARLKNLEASEESLSSDLKAAYPAKYRDILRREKKIDFPSLFSSFINAVGSYYKIESISLKDNCDSYHFEAVAYLDEEDKPFIGLRLPHKFKRAKLENILLKDKPGLKVTLDIF